MAEKDQELQQEEVTKSSNKLIIIIAGVVLLLGAAGGGYYLMSGEDDTQKDASDVEEAPEQQASEILYYDMTKSFIVNYPKGSAARLVQVSVSLMVEGEATIEGLKKHEPMIRNNILMLMGAQDTSELHDVAGKEKLRVKMLEEINSVMKKMTQKSNVKELFFTAFVMQ